MRGRRRSRARSALAFLHYVRRPLLSILPQVVLLAILLVGGAVAFHTLYDPALTETGERLGLVRSLYLTWALVFMEHLLPFPEHWLLRAFYFLVPIVGLVVVLDGIIRMSYYLLRRDAASPEWTLAMTKTYRDHVILMGLGKVGLRVLEELLRLDELVVVLENDASCENLDIARSRGIPVVVGNGRTPGVLENLGVDRAKSLICATDDDLANLEVALDARKIRPDIRIVLRMFDKELAQKIKESMDIHLALSTAQIAAPLLATSASDRSIESSFYVGSRLLVVSRIEVAAGSRLAAMSIGELEEAVSVHVLEHERNSRENYDPSPSLALTGGDRLAVQTEPHVLDEVHLLNERVGIAGQPGPRPATRTEATTGP